MHTAQAMSASGEQPVHRDQERGPHLPTPGAGTVSAGTAEASTRQKSSGHGEKSGRARWAHTSLPALSVPAPSTSASGATRKGTHSALIPILLGAFKSEPTRRGLQLTYRGRQGQQPSRSPRALRQRPLAAGSSGWLQQHKHAKEAKQPGQGTSLGQTGAEGVWVHSTENVCRKDLKGPHPLFIGAKETLGWLVQFRE